MDAGNEGRSILNEAVRKNIKTIINHWKVITNTTWDEHLIVCLQDTIYLSITVFASSAASYSSRSSSLS